MPFERNTFVHLAAVQAKDAVINPFALLVDAARDLRRPEQREVVYREPCLDRSGGLADFVLYYFQAQGSVGGWTDRHVLAALEVDRGNHLQAGRPIVKRPNRVQVVINRPRHELFVQHELFELLQVCRPNLIGPELPVQIQKPSKVVCVVGLAGPADFDPLGRHELLGNLDDGRDDDLPALAGLILLVLPALAIVQAFEISLLGFLAVCAQIMILSTPINEILAGGVLAKGRDADGHRGRLCAKVGRKGNVLGSFFPAENVCKCLILLTPRVGLEPTTFRLTACKTPDTGQCSTQNLPTFCAGKATRPILQATLPSVATSPLSPSSKRVGGAM